MDTNQHIAKLLESTKPSPAPATGRLLFWPKKHQHKSNHSFFAVCLHVHQLSGLPLFREGQFITATWDTRRSEIYKTMPIEVCQGLACYDEVFLHYCTGIEEARAVLRGIAITVSLVGEGVDCELGEFRVDLSEVIFVEGENLKMVSVDLDGFENGGVLSIGVYCRVLDEEEDEVNCVFSSSDNDTGEKQRKSKCFSCLPGLKKLRILPKVRRPLPSLPETQTTENSVGKQQALSEDINEEEAAGFITMEKGVFHRNPPSDEECEDEDVENEFLRMLAVMKCSKKGSDGSFGSSGNYMSLDLDVLVTEAEEELQRAAAQAWRRRRSRRVGGEMMEREEYEELMMTMRWRENEKASTSSCFGSPF